MYFRDLLNIKYMGEVIYEGGPNQGIVKEISS